MRVKCGSNTGIEVMDLGRSINNMVAVTTKCGNGVVGSVWMTADTARQVAAELNRLADVVEEGGCHQSPS
ncbi:hypothetical protein DDSR119_55 [Pseudomonas phage DDSR119]|nr:hypothetical protein DDSR119_55 [Pseudomonas phage DDSR119]